MAKKEMSGSLLEHIEEHGMEGVEEWVKAHPTSREDLLEENFRLLESIDTCMSKATKASRKFTRFFNSVGEVADTLMREQNYELVLVLTRSAREAMTIVDDLEAVITPPFLADGEISSVTDGQECKRMEEMVETLTRLTESRRH